MNKNYIFLLLLLLLAPLRGGAQEIENGDENIPIYIKNAGYRLVDDHLYIQFTVRSSGVRVNTWQRLQVVFMLESEGKQVMLPALVYTGKLSAAYYRRNKSVAGTELLVEPYHIYTGLRKDKVYELGYLVNVPYWKWMDHASLRVRQIFDRGFRTKVNDQIICTDLNLKLTE
ncbi:hypothetical protein LJC38_01600 [Parabacteroides sp. OttesenSCG-928-K15]|nr:hypothetical protein [Parabacteroides sp. OttesenSCG-928-K15]